MCGYIDRELSSLSYDGRGVFGSFPKKKFPKSLLTGWEVDFGPFSLTFSSVTGDDDPCITVLGLTSSAPSFPRQKTLNSHGYIITTHTHKENLVYTRVHPLY